jgi:glycosyltransferase involved in cell wall biosynthesis
VIVPTYNRAELLSATLSSLCGQTVGPDSFEVVVGDDGSTDGTRDVVAHYQDLLTLRYHQQPDQGRRPGAARNGAARLTAAPLLCFLDTGAVVGTRYVASHLDAHRQVDGPAAVIGYVYGYRPFDPWEGLAELHQRLPAEEVVEYLERHRVGLDMRHERFADVDFDLRQLPAPWSYFFTVNVSVGATDFWQAGGFDEDFVTWGVEDIELGYRLAERGATFTVSREAWAMELPQDRATEQNRSSHRSNADLFLRKHRVPVVELFSRSTPGRVNDDYRQLLEWRTRVRHHDTGPELAALAPLLSPRTRVVVIGGGGALPARWPPSTVVDFDEELLPAATAQGHLTIHGVGVNLPLHDGAADLVVVTSRLSGLWGRWREEIEVEAHRIGAKVRLTFG